MLTNRTLSALVSPVSSQELADFLSLDYDSSMHDELQAYLLAACDAAIGLTNHELLERAYTLETSPNISEYIKIPVYPVSEVTEVLGDNVAIDYEDKSTHRPGLVRPLRIAKEYKITYTAGYSLAADIPPIYTMAIKQMAGYMYDNRGCEMGDAVNNSGAKIGLDLMKMRYDLL